MLFSVEGMFVLSSGMALAAEISPPMACVYFLLLFNFLGSDGHGLAPEPMMAIPVIGQPLDGPGFDYLNPILDSGLGRASLALAGSDKLQLTLGQSRLEPSASNDVSGILPSQLAANYQLTDDPENHWCVHAGQRLSGSEWEAVVVGTVSF